MKTFIPFFNKPVFVILLILSFVLFNYSQIFAQNQDSDIGDFQQYSGEVIDAQTKNPLVFASLSVLNSNISTITNSEGDFLLKVPVSLLDENIVVSMLGYKKRIIPISQLHKKKNKIQLTASVTQLPEVVFLMPKDAKALVQNMFKKKKENNLNRKAIMTAFYRETIKRGRKNASLSEAIVTLYKEPYTSYITDKVKLYKARKSTDYSRLDTIALKLQGGPFNALFVDMIKYPEYVFPVERFDQYDFSFAPSTTIGMRHVYVVKFMPNTVTDVPLYYGELFIDATTGALISAVYKLDVSDKEKAADLFVKRKPKDVITYPTAVSYRVNYRIKDGKWYYGYGNAQLSFKVKRKGKWFGSNYSVSSEMAVTDWRLNTDKEKLTYKEKMRYSVIISDEASGFSDPEFWGPYNVIEPDKSIEVAIKKIKRKLTKGVGY